MNDRLFVGTIVGSSIAMAAIIATAGFGVGYGQGLRDTAPDWALQVGAHVPCEDDSGSFDALQYESCYWDAAVSGNRVGKSFVQFRSGGIFYPEIPLAPVTADVLPRIEFVK